MSDPDAYALLYEIRAELRALRVALGGPLCPSCPLHSLKVSTDT